MLLLENSFGGGGIEDEYSGGGPHCLVGSRDRFSGKTSSLCQVHPHVGVLLEGRAGQCGTALPALWLDPHPD